MKKVFIIISVFLCLITIANIGADVEMNSVFTHNMVLQRNVKASVFGYAEDGENVTVSINGQKVSAVTIDGKWIVRLEPMKAGGPYEMTIKGKNEIILKNIMIGDVWLLGGQSNMDYDILKYLDSKHNPEESKKYQKIVLYGSGSELIKFSYSGDKGQKYSRTHSLEGIINNLERRYRETESNVVREELAKYLSIQPCPSCEGTR